MPLLFALDQQLIVSSAAPLTYLILVNRETLLQARLLPVTLYAVKFSLASVQVQSGGGGNPSLVSSMPPGVVPGPVDSASAPPSLGRGNYLPTHSQALYLIASSSPSACCLSSGFDGVNEEANVRVNAAIVEGKIFGASSRVATSLDLDLAFGAIDINNNLDCTSLLSPLSPLPPPTVSPPSPAAAGEPI